MAGGKSTECLIEEISVYTNGITPLFQCDPIDVAQKYRNSYQVPEFTGCTFPNLPQIDDLNVFNGFYLDTETHLQVEVKNPVSESPPEHDWHIQYKSDSSTGLSCSMTGNEMKITSFEKFLPLEIIESFKQSAIDARIGQPEHGVTSSSAWALFGRIVHDLITTPVLERREINPESNIASKNLDVNLVLPFLGFVYSESTKKYSPPTNDDLFYFRRVLLEINLYSSERRVDFATQLAEFFHVNNRHHVLSPSNYLGLGASSAFPDSRIGLRYRLQTLNDVKHTPYYLEYLKGITEARHSEQLETTFVEAISLGNQTLSQLDQKLAGIGLDVSTLEQLSDEQIVELVYEMPDPEDNIQILQTVSLLRPDSVEIQRITALLSTTYEDALNRLGIYDENISNKDILERVESASDESIYSKTMAKYILLILGIQRKSALLLSAYESLFQDLKLPSLSEAYAILRVEEQTDNQFIKMSFVSGWEDTVGYSLLGLRNALRVIALARSQHDLLEILNADVSEEDQEDPETYDYSYQPTRNPNIPVGLWNIGNTCYLNSILQFYYSLKPIRDYVIEYKVPKDPNGQECNLQGNLESDASGGCRSGNENYVDLTESSTNQPEDLVELDGTPAGTSTDTPTGTLTSTSQTEGKEEGPLKKIGGREVPTKEIKRSQIFVELLGNLFREIRDTKNAQVTPSEILAYMSLVPPREDADDVIVAASKPHESNQNLKVRLMNALRNQQDVTECIENMLYQLEVTMEPTEIGEDGEQIDLVKDLFYGTTIQTLQRISDGGNKRTKHERYSSLMINVGNGPTSIYEAIDGFFADDVVTVADGPTLRTLKIESLPKFMQFQVQRVQFDYQTFESYKNQNPVVFDPVIYLDRYLQCDPESELANANCQVKQWKTELQELQEQINNSQSLFETKDAFETTLKWAERESNISESTFSALNNRYTEIAESLSALHSREEDLLYKIEHGYDKFQKQGYRIHSLFIHRGDVSYGHYWIYIWDPNTESFYSYNDELVTRISLERVFDFSKSNRATPYFMVFVREDSLELASELTTANVPKTHNMTSSTTLTPTPPSSSSTNATNPFTDSNETEQGNTQEPLI